MVKVKYDLSKSDPESAKAIGTLEPPKPGIYRYQVAEVNASFSKDADGQPDRNRPRLEVIFSCLDEKYKGTQLWFYVPLPDSTAANDFSTQKFDQLLQAVGHTDGKKNRKGTLDTDRDLKGKTLKIRVRGGTNLNGDYRAEYGSAFPDDGADGDASVSDDELMEDEEEFVEDVEEAELEDEEEFVDEEEAEEFDAEARQAELAQMAVADLKALGKELDIALSGKTKSTLVDAIIEAESAAVEEVGEDEEDVMEEDEEIVEEDEESEYLTREELMAMDRKELATTAKDFDITPSGMKRSEVVDAILTAQAAPDDEAPF